uniref:thyrotropin receptor-like n=1 Tax=Styela clava TaxID=7725 RepID=UPI0019395FEF|nr:thyrotropin receptor-like [Styela clava]
MTSNKDLSVKIHVLSIFICVTNIIQVALSAGGDDFLQVAMHDRCNEDDLNCGLPVECCCKPTHNFNFKVSLGNDTNDDKFPVQVLCVNATEVPSKLPKVTETFKLLQTDISVFSQGSFPDSNTLKNLSTIYIWKNSKLREIQNFAFFGYESLSTIILEDLPELKVIEQHAFSNLPSLRLLKLKHVGLTIIPSFTGLASSSLIPLEIILENTQISQVISGAFQSLPVRIKIVQLSWNLHLTTINDFAFNGSSIAQLNLNDNKQLTSLAPRAFHGMKNLENLILRGTSISTLPTNDLKTLIEIDVRRTPLLHRFPAAQELPSLRVAWLTYTYHCCSLNAYGFGSVFNKNTNENTQDLRPCGSSKANANTTITDIPDKDKMENITSGHIFPDFPGGKEDVYDLDWENYTLPSYVHPVVYDGEYVSAYHENEDPEAYDGRSSFLQRIYYQASMEGSWEDDYETSTGAIAANEIGGWRESANVPTDATRVVDSIELCYTVDGVEYRAVYHTPVKCTPEPDAFNPCENVLGTSVLPAISWIVSALAIIGNFFVILVLSVVTCDRSCARQHHLSVQKFLVLNLAVADMCMGVYLLMVSSMDARSSGEYYKYGVEWQTGIGCKISGFLSIFSSQLSVYTLSVISLERWYAIRFAIHLDKRMTMRCARVCIFFGWLVAGLLAILPLVGVNNYEKTSICLPFDVSKTSGMAYVGVLLFIAIGAFVVDVICYLWMYTTVRTVGITDGRKRRTSVSSSKSGAFHGMNATADAIVAKRMAILVFTNFACFFPISFFALTAAAGKPLISISQSKILLVIFYPLNSCCNPFLYAILTKSFRRDLLTWFTSRGYCIPLAAKLNGAHWRRNSIDPGSAERRDTYRKRFQQCVKYVTNKRSVHMDIGGEASANSRDSERVTKNHRYSPSHLKPLNIHNGKIAYMGKHAKTDLDNNSNSISSYHSTGNSQSGHKGMSRFFKLALGTKKFKEPTTPTEERVLTNRQRPIFPEIRWFRSQRNRPSRQTSGEITSPNWPRPEDSSPLMETLDSRNECDFSMPNHENKKSAYKSGRRASKSRHSTTTIETRLTVGGNTRGSVDHGHILQDTGASTP